MADRGRYTCVVSNAGGSSQTTASLILTEPKEDYRTKLRKGSNQIPSAINSERVAKFCQSVISPTQEMIARANRIDQDEPKMPTRTQPPTHNSPHLRDRPPRSPARNDIHKERSPVYHEERSPVYNGNNNDKSLKNSRTNSPQYKSQTESVPSKISALKNIFQQDTDTGSSKFHSHVHSANSSPRVSSKISADTLEAPSRSRSFDKEVTIPTNVLTSRSRSCERLNDDSAIVKQSNKSKQSKVHLLQNKFDSNVSNQSDAKPSSQTLGLNQKRRVSPTPVTGSSYKNVLKSSHLHNGDFKMRETNIRETNIRETNIRDKLTPGRSANRSVSPSRIAFKDNDSWISKAKSSIKQENKVNDTLSSLGKSTFNKNSSPSNHSAVCLPVRSANSRNNVISENVVLDNHKETDFREIIRNKSYDRLQKRGSIDSGVSDMSDRDVKTDYRSILGTSTPRNLDVLPQTDRVEHRELLHRQSEPIIRPHFGHDMSPDVSDIMPVRANSLEPSILSAGNSTSSTTMKESESFLQRMNKTVMREKAPRILHNEPSSISVPIGETVIVKTRFSGEPVPSVKWQKHHRDVRPSERISIITSDNESVLTIRRIHPSDGGIYTLILENKLGVDSKTASVINVEEPPSAPVGKIYATNVGTTELVLSWHGPAYDGGSLITGYRIELCENNQTKWKMLTNCCKNTTYHVTNLPPNSAYKFRVSCENKCGISEPGQASDAIYLTTTNIRPTMLESDSEEELPFEPRSVGIIKDKKFEDNYEVLEEIGRGKFGSVFRCKDRKSTQIWAAKVLKCREREKPRIRQEVDVMNILAHPKVLMLWEAYEAPRNMVLVMEYIGGGELFERVSSDSYELTESDCTNYMRQICEAVCYIHHRNIIHLDLKPENIVCVSPDNNKVKLIDFGLAKKYEKGETAKVMEGTPEFIAPEVVNYDEICFQTDMWSVGVICYVLLSGLSPFMGDNDQETLSNVTRADFDFDDESFDEISEYAKDFICQLLIKNKAKRLTSQEVIRHPWLAHENGRIHDKRLNTEKLRRFLARRKWQKTGTAIRALGRMASLQRLSAMLKRTSTSSMSSEGSLLDEESECSSPIQQPSCSVLKEDQPNNDHSEITSLNGNSMKSFNLKASAENHMQKSSSYDSGIYSDHSHNVSCDSIVSESHRSASKPLVFLKTMRDSEAFVHDAIRFDIKLSGEPDKILWTFEDETVLEDDRHYIDCNEEGHCSLIIRNVNEDDEGEYSCSASNSCGEVTCSADLIICGAV